MKIRKNRKLKESAAGPYWLVTRFFTEEDRTEFEIVQGPRQEAIDYMVAQTVDFLIEAMGQEEDYSMFLISPTMAARLDNSSTQTAINQTIKEIYDFKVPVYATSSINASDWVVDYVNDTNADPDAILDDPSFDVFETAETPDFKKYLTGKIKADVDQAFNNFFS